MSGHIEIEKKYKILSGSLRTVLTQFQYEGEKRVVDNYFDTPAGHFYQRGIFIRIRNDFNLDIKFNPDHLGQSDVTDHVSCHEYSFQEPFQNADEDKFQALNDLIGLQKPLDMTFKNLLERNQLCPLLTIDKMRKTYQNQNYTLVIDEIEGLGQFLEIEYSGPPETTLTLDQILSEIDGFMAGVPAKPLSTGSFEMILRKDNYDLYKKGKYLLESDREMTAA